MRHALVILAALVACLGVNAPTPAQAPVPTPDAGTPPAATAWTMVVLPDVQSYTDHSERMKTLELMIQWIIDNRERENIALVVQVGDFVFQNGVEFGFQSTGNQSGAQQYRNAQRAFHRLNGVVPYILAPGNHNYGRTCAEDRRTRYSQYFQPTDNPLVDPARGGILAEMGLNAESEPTLENAAYDFTAPDGRQWLILSLEWGPRQAAVDWANAVATRLEYVGHTKLLLTHAYLYHDNMRYDWARWGKAQANNPHDYPGTSADTHDGEELWAELVGRDPGFELVLCGHVGGDMVGYLASPGASGQTVHQMLFNAQFLPGGGQGWLRLLRFAADGRTVHAQTYSPLFDQDGDPATYPWRMGAEDDFTFELTPQQLNS